MSACRACWRGCHDETTFVEFKLHAELSLLMPTSHGQRRRDKTVELRRVGRRELKRRQSAGVEIIEAINSIFDL